MEAIWSNVRIWTFTGCLYYSGTIATPPPRPAGNSLCLFLPWPRNSQQDANLIQHYSIWKVSKAPCHPQDKAAVVGTATEVSTIGFGGHIWPAVARVWHPITRSLLRSPPGGSLVSWLAAHSTKEAGSHGLLSLFDPSSPSLFVELFPSL